jgi:hypothetical protein
MGSLRRACLQQVKLLPSTTPNPIPSYTRIHTVIFIGTAHFSLVRYMDISLCEERTAPISSG